MAEEALELDRISVDSKTVDAFYKQFEEATGQAFAKIVNLARSVNLTIQSPEVVICGNQGSGKSTLLEAILGHRITFVGGTRRPLLINMINNPEANQPKITIKRDTIPGTTFTEDVVVDINKVPQEVAKRNEITEVSAVPIQIKYEWSRCGNLTLIDTPGLPSETSETDFREEREKIVQEFIKPSHRIVLCVEEAKDWESVSIIEFAKKNDPKLSRTIVIFTKFHQQIQRYSNTREAVQLMAKKPSEAKCYFVSLVNQHTRQNTDLLTFQKRIFQAWKRDLQILQEAKIDKRNEEFMSVQSVRLFLLETAWKAFKDAIPDLRKQISVLKKNSSDQLKQLEDQLYSSEVSNLRSAVSNYVADWLQVIIQLIDGSTEGNPAVNGQTLEAENIDYDVADWLDNKNRAINVMANPSPAQMRTWENKIYGGHQIERMMSLFRSIVKQSEVSNLSADDIRDSFPITCGQESPLSEFLQATSLAITKRLDEVFGTLIEQMCERGAYIMRRIPDIAFYTLETRTSGLRRVTAREGGLKDLSQQRGYHYFKSIIKDLYLNYIERLTLMCKEKCMNEITQSQLIPWRFEGSSEDFLDQEERVIWLTNQCYEKLKESITQNIMLKGHNYFLIQTQRDLSGEVLKNVSSFEDKFLEEVFQLKRYKEDLREEISKQQAEIQNYQDKESTLRDLTAQFSRFK